MEHCEAYRPEGIVRALELHACQTLTVLDLTANRDTIIKESQEDSGDGVLHVGTLQWFALLELLRLDDFLLHFPRPVPWKKSTNLLETMARSIQIAW